MSFTERDLEAIFSGLSHTTEAHYHTTNRLLQMTPEEIQEIMSKPTILRVFKKRLQNQCQEIRELIKDWRSPEDIRIAFVTLWTIANQPFHTLRERVVRECILRPPGTQKKDDKLVKFANRELNILSDTLPELPDFRGGGAGMLSLNATFQNLDKDDMEKYIQTIIDILIAWCSWTMTYSQLTPDILDLQGIFMNKTFLYWERKYVLAPYNLDWWKRYQKKFCLLY